MIKQEIEKTFYLGQKLPSGIVSVCEYLDKNGYPISGCFELSTIGMEGMLHWFRNKPEAVDLLMPFGRGACGDVYALWLINNLEPEDAPVVMFGSEGELSVLAKNAKEFCMLLCLGYSELGLENHTKVGENFEETRPFREYIQKIYNFQLPETCEETINQAKQMYPYFANWAENYD